MRFQCLGLFRWRSVNTNLTGSGDVFYLTSLERYVMGNIPEENA